MNKNIRKIVNENFENMHIKFRIGQKVRVFYDSSYLQCRNGIIERIVDSDDYIVNIKGKKEFVCQSLLEAA